MKKYKVYMCCPVDVVFTLRANSREDAEKVFNSLDWHIVSNPSAEYTPENFSECKVYTDDYDGDISMIEECTEIFTPSNLYDIFYSFYVDYEAVIEAETEDEIEDIIFSNYRNLFDCDIRIDDDRLYSVFVYPCDDYNLHEIKELDYRLFIA